VKICISIHHHLDRRSGRAWSEFLAKALTAWASLDHTLIRRLAEFMVRTPKDDVVPMELCTVCVAERSGVRQRRHQYGRRLGLVAASPEMHEAVAPVSTTSCGLTEVVVDGQDGLLVPPGDAESLTSALEALTTDRALLARLRMAAHATAQPLSWHAAARQRLDVYERLLGT
jgi:glycosyltransferase involved in cell wall biosynthesis